MGVHFVDLWTIVHLLLGFICRLSIFQNNIVVNFWISNGIHLIIEFCEQTVNPDTGEILENDLNHIGDILFFLIGWLCGDVIFSHINPLPNWLLWIFRIIIIVTLINDIGREIISPYNWPIDSAFNTLENRKKKQSLASKTPKTNE